MVSSKIITLALAAITSAAIIRRDKTVWQPPANSRWQIVLTGSIPDMSAHKPPIVDVDVFDTQTSAIAQFKQAGQKVICYFSAGTYEDWRPDAGQFSPGDMGAKLPQWKGEQWLNVRSAGVWTVMAARMKMASEKGCDAVDPDNMGTCRV